MSHVFVSYSKKNKDYVLRLVDKLLDEGFDVWIDNRRLRSSDDWWRSIVEALRDCGAVVVVLTPESDASEWVQLEVTLAMKYKKQRFPILLAGSMDTPNWAIFARTQYIDATNGQLPPADFFDELAAHARRKSFRGSAVASTGRLDQKITQVMEDDPVLQEALNRPPQSDEEGDDDDLDVLLKRIASVPARRSRLLIGSAAAIILLLAAVLIVPRLSSNPVTPTATGQIAAVTATLDSSIETVSATPDLSRLPVTFENLNMWRVQQSVDLQPLVPNDRLDEVAGDQLDNLINLSVSERKDLENLEQWQGVTAQEMAAAKGYTGDVQMIVKVAPDQMMMDELLTRIEMSGGSDAETAHRQFRDIGLKMEQSVMTDEWFLVLVLGSGSPT